MKTRLLTILLGILCLTGCTTGATLGGRDLWYPSGEQLNPVSSEWGIDVATSTIPVIRGGEASTDNLTLYSNPYQDGYINLGDTTRIKESLGQLQIGLDPDIYGFQDSNVGLMVSGYQNTYYGLNVFNLLDDDSASAVIVAATAPTSYITLGQAAVSNTQPEYAAMTGGSGFLMTADSDLYVGAGGTTSSTGNVYLVSGGLSDPDNVRLSLAYNGNVGIGLGKTLATYPLQVGGRARFNDSIGIDTDPSTFGMDIRGSINYVGSMKPVNAMSAALAGVAGNIDNGTHRYRVSYYTALGETQLSTLTTNISITDKTSNGQINLTNIPISTDTKVTGRRIYRTLANTTASYYLLVDIPNNTSTTYTDNTADADLGDYDNSNRDNTTRGRIRIDGNQVGFFGDYNTGLGLSSLGNGANIPGYYNFALGNFALYNLVNGVQNSAIGAFAGVNIVDGTSNMLAGFNSGRTMVSTIGSTFYGVNSGFKATGNYNTIYGFDAGYRLGASDAWALTTGDYDLFIGYQAGLGSATQRSYASAIGYKARVDKDYGIVLGGTGTDAPWVGINTTTPNSRLQVAGSFSAGYVEKTANYTLTENDYTVNCTSGTFTITLPTAVGIQGRIYNIKNTGTGVITVTPNGAETIDGDASEVVNEDENLQIQSTNAGWIILKN